MSRFPYRTAFVVLSCPLAALASPAAHAQLVTYNSLTTFQAAFPTTILEDFEDGTAVGNIGNGPLDKFTNDGTFLPGAIADGLRLNFPGPRANEYFYTAGSFGLTSKGIVTNAGANTLDVILYNNNATAVGFDLSNGDSFVNYQVFDIAGNRISSGTFNASTQAFLGFSNLSGGIGRVNIDNPNQFEAIDNIRFNNTGVVGASAPEPGTLALFALGTTLLGAVTRRRNSSVA